MARKWPSYLPWQLNVARRPPVVNMVAYLAQPQSAMRRQVAWPTSSPQRVAESSRKVPLYTRRTRRASHVWTEEMTP